MFGLLAARERGEDFLGRSVASGSCLFLTEEGARTLNDKVFAFDIAGDQIEVLLRNEVLDLTWEQIAEDAIRRCREQGHDLLVIDTAATWMGLEGEHENHAGYVTAAFRPLERCRELDIGVVVKHHASKAGGAHGKAARGSGAFAAAVDIMLELEHVSDEDDGPRVLKVQTRLDASKPDKVGVHYEDGAFDHTHDIANLKPNPTRADITGLMADGKKRTLTEIAETVGKSEGTVQRYLPKMHKSGLLNREGRGAFGDPYLYWAGE
jgi:hypothetical protein